VLTDDVSVRDFRHVPPGVLLFRRVGANQGLWAVPFAETTLDLGRAVSISPGATEFSVSNEGTLVVRSEVPPTSTLDWLARDGSATRTAGTPIADLYPWIALSPGGDRVAFIAGQLQPALFVRDLATGADTRLTTDAAGLNVTLGPSFMLMNPAWFPGGDRVLYSKGPIEGSQLVAQRADGGSELSPVTAGYFGRVSRDGKWFLWLEDNRGQGRLRYAALTGNALGEARTVPALEKLNVRSFDLSPDGRLLAYSMAGEDRQLNIYLIEFPGAAARWQVTNSGGTYPHFSHDARELVFLSGSPTAWGPPEGRLMVMPLTPGPPVKLGVAKALLTGSATPNGFDAGRDGRLLVARRVPGRPGEESRAVLVQNWPLLVVNR
jgi:hypothetical protein